MRIIVDVMGGDNAPQATVRGAIDAVKDLGVTALLVGKGEAILEALAQCGLDTLPHGLEVANADQVVTMEDNPATAFKDKPDSSLTVGLTLLREGRGDAFVSAGSTGALLSGATLLVKRIKGIRRAALAPVIPTGRGGAVLIDCGATAECTSEYLLQYAYMGSYYAKRVLGREAPSVGLLNIGAEPGKGTALQQETYLLLQEAAEHGRIRFTGNVEAREAVEGAVDVIVADGYAGNIFLKAMEGTGLLLTRELKNMFLKTPRTKLAALLARDGLREFKKLLDAGEVGGTALLGISKPVIKAHGSSDAYAIRNAIAQAARCASSDIIADLTQNVEYMRLKPKGTSDEKIQK